MSHNNNSHEPWTYSSECVLVRTGVTYKALVFSYALAVVLVCSDMVAGIKLLGTWQRMGRGRVSKRV